MAITACTLTHLGPLPAESPNGTSSGIPIGTAFADRLVVILIPGDFTGASLSGAVGGTNFSTNGLVCVISAFIPSGTTTTLTVTGGPTLGSGAPALDFPICAVYAIAGATSNVPTDSDHALGSLAGGTTPMTVNLDVLSDGAIIAVGGDASGAGTAFTAGVDSDGTATPGVSVRAGSREYSSGGTFAVTNAGNYALLVASFAGSGGTPSNDLAIIEPGPDTFAATGQTSGGYLNGSENGADTFAATADITNGPFPTVAARTSARTTATDTTSHAITLPSGITAGDLLLVVFSVDGNPTVTVNTGVSGNNWNKLGQASNSTVVTGAIFWKIAQGSDALTLTTSASEQSSHVSLRLTQAQAVTGTSANGSSTNSNPPSHTPPNGNDFYLWVATRSGDSTVVATVAPTDFLNLQTLAAAGANGASSNTAERLFAGTVLDPATFTSGNEQWVSWTLAVQPSPSTIEGDLAAVESGPDTAAATGTIINPGSMAVGESGTDSFAGTGSVGSTNEGDLAATEAGPDTFAATGSTILSGTMAATEAGADTFAGTAQQITTGSLSAGEPGPDAFSATGSTSLAGAMAAQENGPDTVAMTGVVIVSGALAVTEPGPDVFAGSSPGIIIGTMAAGENGPDVFSGDGIVGPVEPPTEAYYGGGGWVGPDRREEEYRRKAEDRAKLRATIRKAMRVQAGEPDEVVQAADAVQAIVAPAVVGDGERVDWAALSGQLDELTQAAAIYAEALAAAADQSAAKAMAEADDEDVAIALLLAA